MAPKTALTAHQQAQKKAISDMVDQIPLPGPLSGLKGLIKRQLVDQMVRGGISDILSTVALSIAGRAIETTLTAGATRVFGEKAKEGFFHGGILQMEAFGRTLLKTGGFLDEFQVGLDDVGRSHFKESALLGEHMQDMYQYGVSFEDYGKAATKVASNYMGVVNKSFRDPSVRKSIRDHVAIYDELGIGAETATSAFNFFGQVLGGRADDVIKATNQMDALARISGQSLGAITKDVLANKASFVGFMDPESIVKIGGALQQYGKQLGLGMGPLLQITEKFDTFESAFDTSARLNQVLMRFGTSIDPRKLVGMTPEQRIKELNRVFGGIKGQMMAQGPVVRNLLTGALGDVIGKEQAVALLSGKLTEAKVVPETARLEDFAKKQAKAIVDPMQKLTAALSAVKMTMTADPEMLEKLSAAFSKSSDKIMEAWEVMPSDFGKAITESYLTLADQVNKGIKLNKEEVDTIAKCHMCKQLTEVQRAANKYCANYNPGACS